MKRAQRLRSFAFPFGMAILATAAGCASAPDLSKFTQKPEVELRSVDLQDPSLTAVTMVMGLSVYNPNPVNVTFDKMTYALQLNGREIAVGTLDKHLDLEAGKGVPLEVPVRFHYSDIFETLNALSKSGATAFDFKGTLGAGKLEIPFHYDGKIKLPDTTTASSRE